MTENQRKAELVARDALRQYANISKDVADLAARRLEAEVSLALDGDEWTEKCTMTLTELLRIANI